VEITLSRVRPFGYTITADDGRDTLVQLDYDYPGVAGTFGWSPQTVQVQGRGYHGLAPCDHRGTDGTIDCPDCGISALALITDAAEYLDDHDGATAEDPGYFTPEDPGYFTAEDPGYFTGS
jgi:hypothetical protein